MTCGCVVRSENRADGTGRTANTAKHRLTPHVPSRRLPYTQTGLSLKHIAIRFNGRRRGLPCAGAEADDGPADGGDRIADVGDAGVWIRAWRQKSRGSPC